MTTQQPRHSEPSANNELGDLLRGMLYGCDVISENTQLIVGQPSLQLDNLVCGPDRAPVAVEAEYEAVGTAEGDAKARLGLEVVDETHSIEASIALRYPDAVRFADNLRDRLESASLKYAVFYDDEASTRFPESGWLEGSVTDLADLVRLVSIPQKAVNAAADALETGINDAADVLNQMAKRRPNTSASISNLLGMGDVEQTRRMAAAILANALVFHERIAGMHPGVKTLELVCGPEVSNPKSETLAAWATILDINYWPIFAVARDVLSQLPNRECKDVLGILSGTVEEFDQTGVNNAHDLTGRIFQRLIADRKFLATFYTLPSSAALLARLAVSKLDVDWSDASAISELRIGDFACGTGALLSAVYDQIAARYERSGGDPTDLHTVMMEEILYGCDVMPSAVHITGSTLSGMQPNAGFGQSRLYTMPYGRQSDGTVKIGSLELFQPSVTQTLFNTSDPALRTGSVGEQTATQINVDIPDDGFDMVIMNPPFTRAGSDWEGSERDEDYVKQFRGLATDLDTQKAMANRLSRSAKGSCYHGYAGLASAFAALGNQKLKNGGVIALVLPLSAAVGLSWQHFRQLFATDYADVEVYSISGNREDVSFSSDTGMGECLVVAKKHQQPDVDPLRNIARFASFRKRPAGFAEAHALAAAVASADEVRSIADGPYGGTTLSLGEDAAGELLDAPLSTTGETWGSVRLSDCSLIQAAYSLARSQLWLPGLSAPINLPTVRLDSIGTRGYYHRNIVSAGAPFSKTQPSPTATYPVLWNHHAKEETRLICEPDAQLIPKPGREPLANQIWATAGRSHVNLDFRFNSQPLCVAFTLAATLGGVAWPNVNFSKPDFDWPFALWGNSSLGLLMFWSRANLQQDGRGRTTISAVESLPILDFHRLSEQQLTIAETIFNDFREKEFLPAYLAHSTPLTSHNRTHILQQSRQTPVSIRISKKAGFRFDGQPRQYQNRNRPRWQPPLKDLTVNGFAPLVSPGLSEPARRHVTQRAEYTKK